MQTYKNYPGNIRDVVFVLSDMKEGFEKDFFDSL